MMMIGGYDVAFIKRSQAGFPASRASRAVECLHYRPSFLFGDEMPIQETKKMMRATAVIGVTLALLAVFAMLMLGFPSS